jgi:hypothetical protein
MFPEAPSDFRLPADRAHPADAINAFVAKNRGNRHTVYVTVFKEQDLVKPIAADAAFDLQEYFDHPERYESRFEEFLPSVTLLVNAVYWEKRYPRFVTWAGLKRLAETTSPSSSAALPTSPATPLVRSSAMSNLPTATCRPTGWTRSLRTTHDGHLGRNRSAGRGQSAL